MLFHSLPFLWFFLVVFGLYSLLRPFRLARNVVLLAASYWFYASWHWAYTGLLVFCTLSSWLAAWGFERFPQHRRRVLWIGVGSNLAILFVFKYLGFFTVMLSDLREVFVGKQVHTLQILLPVGISFYTFQAISYVVDVYRGSERPCRTLLDYAVYLSFFPQLVAGPIERAGHIIPQLRNPKPFNFADLELGFFLIVWGLFKKLVIADHLGRIADEVFAKPDAAAGLSVFLGVLAFAFQIYCDFSAYTDMARGLGKFFGIELSLNFRLPYFARDPSEFWQRWHITLSTWIRDYVFIPLGGSRGGTARTFANLLIAMGLAGLWHGAAYNFILWGLYHGLLLLLYHGVKRPLEKFTAAHPGIGPLRVAVTFLLILNGWIYFRAGSLDEIAAIYANMGFAFGHATEAQLLAIILLLVPLGVVEFIQHRTGNLVWINDMNVFGRSVALSAMILLIVFFGLHAPTEFIYFQF